MIAGLEEISGGQIRIDGRVVNDLQPKDRNIAMVFQNYAIYPHVTVADNIAFGLYRSKLSKSEKRARVEQVAQTLGLSHLLERRAVSASVLPLGARWSATLRRSCSMSLFPISMPNCAPRCASRSSGFITGSAPRPCS
jgi:ABC-type thiamine transport system ATPase subunit